MLLSQLIVVGSLILAFTCASVLHEGRQVHLLEQAVTKAAEMDFSSYKLYPFAIVYRQEFSLYFSANQTLRGEIRINWIDITKNQLVLPTYDEGQYVKVAIIDQNSNKTIQERKFHFQTGIKFEAESGHRYKIIFTDFGGRNKMVELAVSKVDPFKLSRLANNSVNKSVATISLGKSIQSQLINITEQTQKSELSIRAIYQFISSSFSHYLLFSVAEICLIGVMMVAQILMLGKLIKSNWTFI